MVDTAYKNQGNFPLRYGEPQLVVISHLRASLDRQGTDVHNNPGKICACIRADFISFLSRVVIRKWYIFGMTAASCINDTTSHAVHKPVAEAAVTPTCGSKSHICQVSASSGVRCAMFGRLVFKNTAVMLLKRNSAEIGPKKLFRIGFLVCHKKRPEALTVSHCFSFG